MNVRSALLAIAFVALSPCAARGQAPVRPAVAGDAVRVFLDCEIGCDFNYLRVETPWAAFVRDRAVADVHLLVIRQETGSGGRQYTINALGLGANAGRSDTLVFSTEPSATDDTRRAELTRYVQLALVPYATRTQTGRSLRVIGAKRDGNDEDGQTGPDRWNAWVFNISADGDLEREQQQSDYGLSADLSARRITAALKVGFELEGDFNRSRFTLDEQVSVSSSTFQNTQLAIRAAPAIEYSAWPYEESTRRQLVAQYSVGVSAFRYREETIFDRLSETRPTHALVLGYDVRQPWGSADAGMEASSYLDDFSQQRLEVGGELRRMWRIARIATRRIP